MDKDEMKKNGMFMSAIVPYGYKRSKKDKYKLVIVRDKADVVRKIFSLAIKGKNYSYIVAYLNGNNIPSPNCPISNRKTKKEHLKETHLWTEEMVKSILNTRLYCGDMVQSAGRNSRYKKSSLYFNEDNWIVVEKTHGMIVSRDRYDKAHRVIEKQYCHNEIKAHLFAGYLKCGDCKKTMRKYYRDFYEKGYRNCFIPSWSNNPNDNHFMFSCNTWMRLNKDLCTPHDIEASLILSELVDTVKKRIKGILKIDKYLHLINFEVLKQEIVRNIKKYEKELDNILYLKKSIYLDFKNRVIDKDDYFYLVKEKDILIDKLHLKLDGLNDDLDVLSLLSSNRWFDTFKKYSYFKSYKDLDDNLMKDLIDKIYIYENKKIDIHLKHNREYNFFLERIAGKYEK